MNRQEYVTEIAMPGTVFQEKRCNVKRIPTIRQVQEFLDLFPYGSKWHAYFSTAFYAGLRPCELAQLTTDDIIIHEGQWIGLRYTVGKPSPPGRPKIGELPKKAKRKWNRIDELSADIPPGALASLRAYWRSHHQKHGILFPKSYTQYGKTFSNARKRMIALGHKNWATSNKDYFHKLPNSKGELQNEHDITPYSARRFFISCYHWLVSSENRNGVPDLIQTQRRMAHSNYKDTAGYVYNWRELGLNPNNVGTGWEILTGNQPNQTRLNEFWLPE